MVTTRDFKMILDDLPGSKISLDLWDIINNKIDVKTNYNAIGLSDKNDEITFIPDNQYQRAISNGQDPWAKTKSNSKIGRMIRQILSDNTEVLSSGGKYTDSQIEEFVNQFKAMWDKKMSVKREVRIVKGEDIKFWYNEKNYLRSGGTLGNSCMRYSSKNDYMNLYAENTDKISLVVLIEEEKLIGRALLWKVDESDDGIKYYLDRIYIRNDSDYEYINDWAFENIAKRNSKIFASYQKGYNKPIKCTLKNVNFEKYPYADTFMYLYQRVENGKLVGGGKISNRYSSSDDYVCLELQNTDGSADNKSHRWSSYLSKFIKREDAIMLDDIKDYADRKDSVMCKYNGRYYLKDNAVFSKAMNDWILSSDAYDHPEYGIILLNALREVVVSHDDSKGALEIYSEIYNNNYSSFNTIKTLDLKDCFLPYHTIGPDMLFDNKYRILDLYADEYPSILCFKLYKLLEELNDNDNIPSSYKSGDKYILEEYADIYNKKIDKSSYIYIYVTRLLDTLDQMFYINYLKSNDKKYNEFFKKLHDVKSMTNRYYRQEYNNIFLVYSKIDNLDDVFFKLIRDTIKDSLNNDNVKNDIETEFRYTYRNYNRTQLSDADKEFIFELYNPLLALYILSESKSESIDLLFKILNNKYNDKLELAKSLKAYIYNSFFDGVNDYAKRNFRGILLDFLNKNKIVITVSDMMSTIQVLIPIKNVENMILKFQ